jgi:OOP family OmpA-OmpF porin
MQPSAIEPKPMPGEVDDLARVRELLLGADYEELLALKSCLNDPSAFSHKIAAVISEAISQRVREDHSMAEVLAPTIKGAIQQSIVEDPHALAESLYPIMGPAIRKSIAETMSQMLENMNQLLEQSLSPRSVGWRFDAWRTGRSYSEVVLMNTLEYQVEQVFLIHNETSLLLQHVVAEMAVIKDPDMVSSMLSAIQDYIQDSFAAHKDDQLSSMSLGDLTVIIEKGPRTILAAVVRGKVPESLRKQLIESQESVQKNAGNQLIEYSGDPDEFGFLQPQLQKCLVSRRLQEEDEEQVKKPPWLAIVAIVCVIIVSGYFYYQRHLLQNWQQQAISNLEHEPGLTIIAVEKPAADQLLIRGLRDPLSRPPEQVAMQDIAAEIAISYDFQPYFSLHKTMLEARAIQRLQPPEGVTLSVDGTTLRVAGNTDVSWLQQLQNRWMSIYGIEKLDRSALTSYDPRKQKIVALAGLIENGSFSFDVAEVMPKAGQTELQPLAEQMISLRQLAALLGQSVTVQIIGATDGTGTAAANLKIAQQRAQSIYNRLVALQVPADFIHFYAYQQLSEPGGDLQQRKVIFRVMGLNKEYRE